MAFGSAVSVFAKGKIHGFFQNLADRKIGFLGRLFPVSYVGLRRGFWYLSFIRKEHFLILADFQNRRIGTQTRIFSGGF